MWLDAPLRVVPPWPRAEGHETQVTERRMTPAMRLLVGTFGIGVVALGLLLATTEVFGASRGAPAVPAVLVRPQSRLWPPLRTPEGRQPRARRGGGARSTTLKRAVAAGQPWLRRADG